MSLQGYVIRTATTFDDSMLRRHATKDVEDSEDQISPRGAMDFPDSTQTKIDKKNTSMTSKESTSSSRSLKRNLSDSQLLASMSKSMHSWKCNLCFHDNLKTESTVCAMCGTNMDASFMAALNALDNLKDPSVHNDEENVSDEDGAKSDGDGSQGKLFPPSVTDRDGSFQTAGEDATFVTFETAQQSVNIRADVSTIYPATVETSLRSNGSMEDEKENVSNAANSKVNSSTMNQSKTFVSAKDTMDKFSQSMVDVSVNSSITMQNQNSTSQNASMLVDSIEAQTTDDSIHTLLNVTHPEADEEFDPMLFQRDEEDAMDADCLYDGQHDEGFQGVECAYGATTPPKVMESIQSHPFGFEKEIQLDEYIKRSQEIQRNFSNQSPDKFPYVPKTDNNDESNMVDENETKNQVQTEVLMGDQEGIVQERESFVNQNIWRIRKTVVVTVVTIVLVSVFAIS